MNTLILTGWGWMEYAVAAAVALKALGGSADVRGISKKHLPGFLAEEGAKWKRIYIIGVSLSGDEQALAETLKELRRQKIAVTWISGLDLTDSLRTTIAPLLKVQVFGNSSFNGALVKAVGEAFGEDITGFLPFAFEKAKMPKAVPPYHELLAAAMYAHRIYQDEAPYATAIRYLATGVAEVAWSAEMKRVVEHYRRYGGRELVGSSAVMKELRSDITRIAVHPEARVLIIGESGTGKETVAAQIHTRSPCGNEPFYAFNCASVNQQLLESRFFGYEKGAFTGAERQTPGLFELADGGTLFLDEIGELPLEAQGTLLRVLEGGRFMRVGGREEIKSDVRLVTATNRNLPRMVREGRFREDLFMRLNVVQIRVPALREHKEDIRDIADIWWFNRFRKHLSEVQIAALMNYDYPGNVRELLNLLERAAVLGETDFDRLLAKHRAMNAGLVDDDGDEGACKTDELEVVIQRHVKKIFTKYAYNLSRAAAALKISRNTLRKYVQER